MSFILPLRVEPSPLNSTPKRVKSWERVGERIEFRDMAEQKQSQDLLSRLAQAGEDAIQRLGEAPGGHRVAEAANALRVRVDELQRKVRGIDELEKRVAKLEQRLTALERKPVPRRRASSASKPVRKAGET